ncbi:hypothetical protein MMC30_003509 [Trapelia coarctata]|nr:hypothetical protein [Trapelia coarctata]
MPANHIPTSLPWDHPARNHPQEMPQPPDTHPDASNLASAPSNWNTWLSRGGLQRAPTESRTTTSTESTPQPSSAGARSGSRPGNPRTGRGLATPTGSSSQTCASTVARRTGTSASGAIRRGRIS